MRKTEILRGREAFRTVMVRGRWISEGFLRAACLVEPRGGGGNLLIGISVPRRVAGAVKRNRAKRVLRVAIGRELIRLKRAVSGSGHDVSIVFQLRTLTSPTSRAETLERLTGDVEKIFQSIPLSLARQ